jgi:hypothetical protein
MGLDMFCENVTRQKTSPVYLQNIAAVLPQLSGHSQQTRADVQNAVNAGKEVTISQAKITYSGWTGAGYVIIDPQTGAGSYLIEGGANGGNLSDASAAAAGVFALIALANKLALLQFIPGIGVYYTLALAVLVLSLALIGGGDINPASKVQQQIGLFTLLATISVALLAFGVFTPVAAVLYFAMLIMIARMAFLAYLEG